MSTTTKKWIAILGLAMVFLFIAHATPIGHDESHGAEIELVANA